MLNPQDVFEYLILPIDLNVAEVMFAKGRKAALGLVPCVSAMSFQEFTKGAIKKHGPDLYSSRYPCGFSRYRDAIQCN